MTHSNIGAVKRWGWTFGGLLCVACAIPGPPRPAPIFEASLQAPPSPTPSCPTLSVVRGGPDGLRLDVLLPASDAPPRQLIVLRAVDGRDAALEAYLEVRLDTTLSPLAASGGVLPLLDEGWPREAKTTLYALRLEGGAQTSDCARSTLVRLTTSGVPSAPTSPPTVDVLGRAAMISATPSPTRGGLRLLRRDVRAQSPARVIATSWDGEAFVDTRLEPGHIYAYSVAREDAAAVAPRRAGAPGEVVGASSPEAYGIIAPVDQPLTPSPP